MNTDNMATAILRYRVKVGAADQVMQLAELELVPAMHAISGFIAHQAVLVGSQSVVFVSTFHDRPAADVGSRATQDWAGRRFASVMEGPANVTVGKVISSTRLMDLGPPPPQHETGA
jgi:hypothetical protein